MPTLDLVRDYSRFVIEFFEVISISAPHIYHSALPLSPQTSIVRDLYKQYARPLAMVARGLPLSWEPVVATVHLEDFTGEATWSPCNRFIAAIRRRSVEILDAVTLNRLSTFECSPNYNNWQLSFSPDSRLLKLYNCGDFTSWDIQTGGLLGTTPSTLKRLTKGAFSFAYSKDRKLVAVAHGTQRHFNVSDGNYDTFIGTYHFPSRTLTDPLRVSEGHLVHPIWTEGECLRFATADPGSITIREVDFTLAHPPAEVESFPVPDKIVDGKRFLFLPSLSRLAFTLGDTIQVWDVKTSKLLLNSQLWQTWETIGLTNVILLPKCSFSSDGRFFACLDTAGVVHVWKESSAGYAPHQRLSFLSSNSDYSQAPHLSPNGESIFMPLPHVIHLWRTRNQSLSLPSFPTECVLQHHFILKFSPDGKFAAFGRRKGTTVTVLDLQSGDSIDVIVTGMEIDCLGITECAVAVMSDEMIVTWNLLGGDSAFDTSIGDNFQTTVLDRSPPSRLKKNYLSCELSPDLSLVAVAWRSQELQSCGLDIHDGLTGTCLASSASMGFTWPRFTQDGREVWMSFDSLGYKIGWEIIEDSKSGTVELKSKPQATAYLSAAFSWTSPLGYTITNNGWVLNPAQKRLLWLPHRWRSAVREQRTWSGRFLGLSQKELSDVVILEFFD